MKNEVLRKLFHLSGLIYAAGFLYLDKKTFLFILAGWISIEFVFEVVRLRSSLISDWMERLSGPILREKEKNGFTGTFWMALGVLLTALLSGPPELGAAVVFYLILGDGVASLAGKAFGGPAWPGSSKRISGSTACFMVCLIAGYFVLPASFGLSSVFAGAFAAAGTELLDIGVDDNLSIPVVSAIVLKITAGLSIFAL